MLSEEKKKSINNKFFYMLHSFLTNIFNQKSPTQKFHLHTGLQNILLIFSPGQLWIYWCSCSIRIFRESQKKTRLIYGFLKSGVTNLDSRRQRKESPHWQMLLAEGLMWPPDVTTRASIFFSPSQHWFSWLNYSNTSFACISAFSQPRVFVLSHVTM